MKWLLPLLLLCLTACSSEDEIPAETVETEQTQNTTTTTATDAKLYIYIYKPNTPVPTRAAYDGDVNPIGHEDAVCLLQIWLFTHDSNKLIGYYSSTETSDLNSGENYEIYQLTIDDDYANTNEGSREHVDVYVAANVKESNCNLTLDHTTTKAGLEAALIKKSSADPFGVTSPVSVVPENTGLPMSGVLRNMPVVGTAPVLRLDDGADGIATVQLIRAVSKLRFAFSRQTGGETLKINSIKLNSGMIPVSEHLFMAAGAPYDRHTCHIKADDGYDDATPDLLSEAISETAANEDPVYYAWGYDEATPEVYEARIETAAADGLLTQRYFYLRESDKLLQGAIKYQIGSGEEQTATFKMVDAGGFSRNHVWTVYSYLAETKLKIVIAEVAPWKQTEKNHAFYNW